MFHSISLFIKISCNIFFQKHLHRFDKMSRDNMVKKVVTSYEKLKNEWAKKAKNLDTCGKYLSEIKVCNVTDICLK